jgi:hypothetical protein
MLLLEATLASIPFSSSDESTRLELVEHALAEINSHGVDAESLVRYGMSARITATLVTHLVLESASLGSLSPKPHAPDMTSWRVRLRLPVTGTPVEDMDQFIEATTQHFERIRRPIQKWAESTSLGDLIRLDPPTASEFDSALEAEDVPPEVSEKYVWAVDRLVEGDLAQWRTTSLHSELQWRTGALPMLFPEAVFTSRQVDQAGLEAEIARRAVLGTPQDASLQLLYQLQEKAKSFLKQNRHAEASALFSFYATFHEDDPVAHNNFAFCQVPVDPAGALESLERARLRGFPHAGILAHNKAICLMQLSREGEALDNLEYYWHRDQDKSVIPCTLWRFQDDGFEIYNELDIRAGICIIGERLAGIVAPSRALVWTERLSSLSIVD